MSKRTFVHAAAIAAVAFTSAVGVRGQGAAAPILVVLNSAAPNPFGGYLPEILRAEGITGFDVVQLSALDAGTLGDAQLAILADTPLSAPQAALFTTYVGGGGRLIAMRPDPLLAPVMGVAIGLGTTTDGYALVSQSGPGAGLQSVTLPYKGSALHFDPALGTTTVAELYTTRTTAAGRPAVVRSGRTAAWAFDLARSTAYMRQGDPAVAGLDRDGQAGYRTNDPFFQTIDLARVDVPHADVQMRLFSRVIASLLADGGPPLPKLWYFPGTSRTMLLPTGDSHTSAPAAYAALLSAVEAAGGRMSVYLSRFLDVSASPVATWAANGHEISTHPYFSPDGLTGNFPAGYTQAYTWFQGAVPVAPGPTVRHHSLEWGGWVDPVSVMASFGVRMDLSYYAWGPALDNPTQTSQAHGYINGSGLPMRFVTASGQLLPVYQQVTALTDEQLLTGVYNEGLTTTQALAVSRQLIDDSQNGGYSAIAAQFHVDVYQFGEVGPWVDGTLAYAAARQIPIWPAARWLRFTEARAATAIANLTWTTATGDLTFAVAVPAGAEPQTLLLPAAFDGRVLSRLTLDGQTVAPTLQSVNGQPLQFFAVSPLPGGGARQVSARYAAAASLPTISIDDVAVIEGDAGTTPATFTVTLSAPSASDITVSFASAAGTAAAGADFQAASGSLTLAAGVTSLPLPVSVAGDVVAEPNETFAVQLANPIGATLSDGAGLATIIDDEPAPSSWTHTTFADFTGCSTAASTRVGAAGDVRLASIFRDDFSGSVLDPRWTSGSWAGPPYSPAPSGGVLSLGNADGAFVRSATTQPTTTLEARAQFSSTPFQSLSLADATLVGTYGRFSTRDAGTNLWALTNAGSGEAQTDLGPIPAGFHIYGIERIAQGATELFRYTIDGAVVAEHTVPAGAIPGALYLFLSHNGGATPTLDFDWIDSGPTFAASGTFDGCPIQALLDVAWGALTWDASVAAGSTLLARTRTSPDGVTWSAWSAPLAASGASITSPNGRYLQYRLELATADPALTPVVRSVTVTAIDPPPPAISIAPASRVEGTGPAQFTVSLSGGSLKTVSAAYTPTGATAVAGADFTAAAGTVTFLPGVTTQTIAVAVTDDALDENDETFTVTLSAPVNGTLGTSVASGTIVDDDAPPAVAVAGTSATEGDAGTVNAVFGVTLSVPSGRTVTVNYATADGTATAGQDYAAASGVVTFAPGVTAQTVAVAVAGDLAAEANETFTLGLSAPVNATLGASTATGTIVDDDSLPTAVADSYATGYRSTRTVAAPGVLGNDDANASGAMSAVLVADVAHGTLALAADGGFTYTPDAGFVGTDGFTYRASSAGGDSNAAAVTITVEDATTVQPPLSLRVADVQGNLVTFRWKAPEVGPAPTGYVIEGGVLPAQTLVSLATGHAAPAFTVAAPDGSFYVRARALGAGGPSDASEEIRVHVGVPVAPSAPEAPQATVSGATLHLAYTPTFGGAPATGLVLDVSGAVSGSIALPATEQLAFADVPAGVYTLRLRAVNDGGASAASAPVEVTVPGVCAEPPGAPEDLLAFATGGTTFVMWDPPAAGAPTGYVITVPGIGTLPTTARWVSGGLPAGTYTIEVRAIGACGASAAATQTLTIP